MSANSASCTPPAPMTAGPSALRNRRVGLSRRGMRNLMPTPCISASPPTTATMNMPATSTPQAAAWPASGKNGVSRSVAMIETLRRMGAPAAAAKRLLALRMPANSVSSETSARYGKVMRVRATARSKRIGSSARPGASKPTTSGVNKRASASSPRLSTIRAAAIWSANSLAAGSPACSRVRA